MTTNLQGNGVRIDFTNIDLEIHNRKIHKHILSNVSAYVLPGRLMALMGPSG